MSHWRGGEGGCRKRDDSTDTLHDRDSDGVGGESKNVGNCCDVIYGWSLSRNQAVGAEQATYSVYGIRAPRPFKLRPLKRDSLPPTPLKTVS